MLYCYTCVCPEYSSAEARGLTSMNGFWKDDVDISWKSNLSEGAFLVDEDFVYIYVCIIYCLYIYIRHRL